MTLKTKRAARVPPISVRVTAAERAALQKSAGQMTLSAYVRARLFPSPPDDHGAALPSDERRKLAASALRKLGDSGLAGSLADLALAARLGTLSLSKEVLLALQTACADINALRADLMKALGLRKTGGGS